MAAYLLIRCTHSYWHWDAPTMRAAFRQAAKTQSAAGNAPPTFVESFARSPAHELLYYSYAESVATGRAVAPDRWNRVPRAAHRFEAVESAWGRS